MAVVMAEAATAVAVIRITVVTRMAAVMVETVMETMADLMNLTLKKFSVSDAGRQLTCKSRMYSRETVRKFGKRLI